MSELSKDEAENFWAHVIKSEQCAYIKIETWYGNTVAIIHALLKEVCGNETLNRSIVRWWHKRFTEGIVSTNDNPWSGHSSIAIDNISIDIVVTILHKDQYVMVKEIEAEAGIPQTTVHRNRVRSWNTTIYSLPYFNWTIIQVKSDCDWYQMPKCIDRRM